MNVFEQVNLMYNDGFRNDKQLVLKRIHRKQLPHSPQCNEKITTQYLTQGQLTLRPI